MGNYNIKIRKRQGVKLRASKALILNPKLVNSGMADDGKTMVEILEDRNQMDIAKYITFVSAPEAGAIATFSGTTRDTFEGKEVIELRYEAYKPMALKCLRSICSSARSRWRLRHVAVGHRLGTVPVGESSVVVAVSAVHRGDAMEACRFVIDELKASVPIWKKEVYSNGEVWKENSEFLERKSCCGSKLRVEDEEISNDEVEKS